MKSIKLIHWQLAKLERLKKYALDQILSLMFKKRLQKMNLHLHLFMFTRNLTMNHLKDSEF